MKLLKFTLPLLALALMLGGCPYKSTVPIDAPSVKVDPALLGKWESKTAHETYYVVSKLDEFSYKIEKKTEDGNSNATYSAHISNVGSDRFLNLKEESSYAKDYYFYKFTLSSTGMKLKLSAVTENIDEVFTTSAELKAFIEKHKSFSFFFDKEEEEYIKAE